MSGHTAESVSWNVEEIVARLVARDNVLPAEAILAAREKREDVAPRLVQVLEEAINAARRGAFEPDDDQAILALGLLTEFQYKPALPVILEGMRLGDSPLDEVFGETTTSWFSRVLAALADDQIEAIEGLIWDRQVNRFVRWEAVQSIAILAHGGRLPREEAMQRLKGYFAQAMETGDDDLVESLGLVLLDFAPREAYDEIAEAMENGSIESFFADRDSLERAVKNPGEETQDLPPIGIPDLIEELSGWACFSEESQKRAAEKREALARQQAAAVENAEQWGVEGIIERLDCPERFIPEAAIRAARVKRQEIAPRLVQLLTDAVTAAQGGEPPAGTRPFLALGLLLEFQEKSILPVVLDLFRLERRSLHQLLNGAVNGQHQRMTAALSRWPCRILASLAADDIGAIESLALDRQCQPIIRVHAVRSVAMLARDKRLPPAEAVAKLQRSLRAALDEDEAELAEEAGKLLLQVAPCEARADLAAAQDKDFIPSRLDLDEICALDAPDPRDAFETLNLPKAGIRDLIRELEACNWSTEETRRRRQEAASANQAILAELEARRPHPPPIRRETPRVGRNDPCPCGSGKKFKKCCGRSG